jgi:CheY-like chemotaxis protein
MGPSGRPRRILIVDDEEPIARFVDRTLRTAGYDTVVAHDAQSALAAAAGASAPFDLLITDLMMPGMTGDELARVMRRDEPNLKVLYLTGYSDHLFRDRVQLWADEAFLDKPVSMNALREAVSLALFGHTGGPQ